MGLDEESGLYYYGARYYAPWCCRFVSVDPLAAKYPFYTPYQYAGNKPIVSIDIDGLEGDKDPGPQGGSGGAGGGYGTLGAYSPAVAKGMSPPGTFGVLRRMEPSGSVAGKIESAPPNQAFRGVPYKFPDRTMPAPETTKPHPETPTPNLKTPAPRPTNPHPDIPASNPKTPITETPTSPKTPGLWNKLGSLPLRGVGILVVLVLSPLETSSNDRPPLFMPADFEKEPFCYNEPECLPEPQPQPVNPGLPVAVDTPEKKKEETVSIYRAPHKPQMPRMYLSGPSPEDALDGNRCLYFAAPGYKSIADEYARTGINSIYYPMVIEFVIDKKWYDENLSIYREKYGEDRWQLVVPASILSELNRNTLRRNLLIPY